MKDYNMMCKNCSRFGADCEGTTNKVYSGCIYKVECKKDGGSMMNNTRICAICGKPVTAGMTDADNTFYCHERHFRAYMNTTYGIGRWMALGNDERDEYGGYYIVSADVVGGYEGTGIYYTEWEDEA